MIKRIFLDIDGVLNTFSIHALQSVGIDATEESYPIQCGWDIVAAANFYAGEQRFTDNSFWRSITRETWATSPKSAEFDMIFECSEDLVGRDNIYFLTAPALDADSVAGKVEWIQRFAPKWMQRRFIITPKKDALSTPESLLIDDADKNCHSFGRAGGHALLCPRPWNEGHGQSASMCLLQAFNKLQNEKT